MRLGRAALRRCASIGHMPIAPPDASYRRQIAALYERSAFYRKKLRAAEFADPAAVGGLAEIARLPFTEKDELRASQAAHPPLGAHAAIDITQAARVYSTSGTSGTP